MYRFRVFVCTPLFFAGAMALAAEDYLIEEILVTAQRFEENVRKVPISVSAFTDAMIEDRQIIGISDLQLNVPNLSYTPQNFGGSRVSIRGIGDLFTGGSARATTVPIHINGVTALVDAGVFEFYDLERVEVSRGPQGTLYGRNATAGAINLVTRRPDFDGLGGYVDLEYGDYDHVRLEGALNLAINDQFAIRVAGVSLERDGYIENKAAGQIPGIDDDMDGRDLHAYRITGEWRPTEAISVRLMYSRFEEDDSKVRITNQVCKQRVLVNLGCDPHEFGLDPVNPGSTFPGLVATLAGVIPFGAKDPDTGLVFEFPRPQLGLREQHTDFNPVFEFDEDVWLLGADWAFEPITLSLSASYFDNSYLSQQDHLMDVGFIMNPTPQNPSGLWPTSAPSGGPGALRGGGPCDLESFRAGVVGGCTLNTDLNRQFVYQNLDTEAQLWSVELRARSHLDGRFNFLVGANYIDDDREGELYVLANTLDLVGLYGLPAIGAPQLYPTFFNNAGERRTESYSVFGELYVELTERLKLTAGLRYNYDEGQGDGAVTLFNSLNVAPFFGGALGADPTWIRGEMVGFLFGVPDPNGVALADHYDASGAIQAATGLDELIAALQIVPAGPRLGEPADLAGWPNKADWDHVSGRIGLDWTISDDALVYAFYTQGYRPGGIRTFFIESVVADALYDDELVHAYEIGAKTLWAEGSLMLTGALFFNDYDDLQMFQTTGPGVLGIRNVDAETMGVELEAVWRPIAWPSLALEFGYAWLESEFKSGESLDQLNRTQGDPNLVHLKSIDGGFSQSYIAAVDQVLPLVGSAIAAGAAIPVPDGVYDNGIPVFFSRGFLDASGVATTSGIPTNLQGNDLPNAPPHSVRLGVAHTWTIAPGAFTLRYDYYWQDSSYARAFNTRGDEIDSWDQHNASVIFESASGRWVARAWIRNIMDDEIVTGHYLEDNSSGNFRNYFLAEPRIYGASLRYNFGDVN